jgi:DNA-binding HxlR family transcriptional regulator
VVHTEGGRRIGSANVRTVVGVKQVETESETGYHILGDLFRKGPLRFQDFQRALQGLGPNTLSARLKSLEAQNVIDSRLYENHPPRQEYFLTEKGKALGPVLKTLRAWGEQYGG